jgi:hypothetical protein
MKKKLFKQPGVRFGAPTAQITVVMRKISELKLAPRNPRIHSKRQIKQIARSIKCERAARDTTVEQDKSRGFSTLSEF